MKNNNAEVSESTPLAASTAVSEKKQPPLVEKMVPDIPRDQQFRTDKTQSKLRTVIFIVEAIFIAIGYTYYLLHRKQNVLTDMYQYYALITFVVVYTIRIIVMVLWLLPRTISVEELIVVMLIFLPIVYISFTLLAKDGIQHILLLVAIILYVIGSYFNTWSELQRKIWKQIPENKGKCYKYGLFQYSRSMNYFGDTILFLGWSIATNCYWNLWVPLCMFLMFYYYHIPGKEQYLKIKYKDEWDEYVKTTKSFVPFVC